MERKELQRALAEAQDEIAALAQEVCTRSVKIEPPLPGL